MSHRRGNLARFTGWGKWGPAEEVTLHYIREGERAALCGRSLGGWWLFHLVPQNLQHKQNASAIVCDACKAQLEATR